MLEARRILLAHRPGTTPVGLVREAYRSDQQVTIISLEELENRQAEVDMFTTVIVGNSTSYTLGGRMVTPRGYEEKR